MNQQGTQDLTRLLQRAMETVAIRHESRSDPLSLDKYREDLLSRRTSYRPDLFGLTLPRVYPEIQDKEVKESLLEFIREELDEYIHEGNIHTPTFEGDAFPGQDPLEQMLWNILKTTIAFGVEKAVQDFGRCAEAKGGSFLKIALLKGASVEGELQVYDGIRLVQLPSSPECFPPYMPDGIMFGVTTRAFTLETLLVMDYNVTPLFRKPVEDESTEFQETLNSKEAQDFDLDGFCQALSLASNAAIRSEFEWEYFDENEISMLSQTGGHRTFLGSPKPAYAFDEYVEIAEDEIRRAKGIYECWSNLKPCVRDALQTPIDRWIRSKLSRDNVNGMIDLGIALESLFLSDNPRQGAFPLRLRGAWYLGQDKDERKELISEFNKVYSWRSDAVHQGRLDVEVKINGKVYSQSEFIDRAQELCLESILKVMRGGQMPDWSDLILGRDCDCN